MLTHAEYSVKIGGWGRGREVSIYHPGRGDYGDPVNRSRDRQRAFETRVQRYYQAAQEARDKVHKAKARKFWAEKNAARRTRRVDAQRREATNSLVRYSTR